MIIKTHDEPLPIRWEKNHIYDDKESLIEENEHESVLPGWLKERKELIFSQDCVEKGKALGSGQFGAVFKGKFIHGNAVYV